jgi:cytochrome c oxidase subunit 2
MMFADIPLFPERASEIAERVDGLLWFMLTVTGLVAFGVILTILVFIVRYRRRSANDVTPRILGSFRLEMFWTLTPLVVFIWMFVWGASIYNRVARPPDDAEQVFVVGKQWMWKIQHADGQREINELHLPLGKPVVLTLTSEDVIHDFAVPAFRTKIDVIPGRYVRTWYLPTKVGRYHIFCDQYCGTSHADMVGTVHVLERDKYEQWLNERADGSLAVKGRQLFLKLECITCHNPKGHAPLLEDLYGSTVRLKGQPPVIADDAYLRESILRPRAKIVEGWEPIMPTFEGQVDEQEIYELIAFIRSLGRGQTPVRNEETPAPIGAPTTPEERAKGRTKKS